MKMTGNMKGNVTRTFYKITGTLAIWDGNKLVDVVVEFLGKSNSQESALEDIRKANPDMNIVSFRADKVEEVVMKVPVGIFLDMAMSYLKVPTSNFEECAMSSEMLD